MIVKCFAFQNHASNAACFSSGIGHCNDERWFNSENNNYIKIIIKAVFTICSGDVKINIFSVNFLDFLFFVFFVPYFQCII